MSSNYHLTDQQLDDLAFEHRHTTDKRYWRFFKKEILYGKYYETFALFKQACEDFFATTKRFREERLCVPC